MNGETEAEAIRAVTLGILKFFARHQQREQTGNLQQQNVFDTEEEEKKVAEK